MTSGQRTGSARSPVVDWMRIGELSARLGVSPHVLRAWERRYGIPRPRRGPDGARLYSTLDEQRLRSMLRQIADGVPPRKAAERASVSRIAVRVGSGDRVEPVDVEAAGSHIRAALDAFDEMSAEHALQQLLARHSTLAVIRDVIIPYVQDLGRRWSRGEPTIAQEHFAAKFFLGRLFALSRGWDRGLGPRALLACAPGDVHCLALLAFGVALHRMGWRITYLGAATPVNVVAEAAGILAPEIVVVSCAVDGALDSDVAALAALGCSHRLMLAGRASGPELALACGAAHLSSDPVSTAFAITALDRPAATGT